MLEKNELLNVHGGAFSAALIDATINSLKFLYELGVNFGTSLYRFFTKTRC